MTTDPRLQEISLYAFLGEDELGSGDIGLKQAILPAVGRVPLVVVDRHLDRFTNNHTGTRIVAQLQNQATRYGTTIYLVRYTFDRVVTTIEPE